MHIVLKTRMGSEPDCRAQSEARSRNPSLVPGQRGWNDLPPRPPPPEERFCDLGGNLTSAIGSSFQDLRFVLVDTAGREDEVMCEFLMCFGRLWLLFVCFSGSSFLPQMRPRRPHCCSLFLQYFAIGYNYICRYLSVPFISDICLMKLC